ncbi:MAG: DUF2029 domain-containing protein [Chloroflexi bacterium]|nr:DUF2029 domain-containing protein [Chloroflexota bacterium]
MKARNRLPILIIIVGVGLAAAASLADLIGLGSKGGVPAVQILAAEIGLGMALFGLWMSIRQKGKEPEWTGERGDRFERILSQPVHTWVIFGFLTAYMLFFILPTFLNASTQFRYPSDFFIEREHIGFDARLTLEHVRVWFTGERPAKYIFPPLTTILFAPLLLLDYPQYYYVITALTLVSTLVLNLLLPLKMTRAQDHLLVYFIFGISIFSYGLQFELETGQFYTIAMLLSLAAIYLFHRHPAYRFFAYVLFCVSIQLKVIPAIFILMFVDDWRDWKSNLRRFAALGLANFLLLFLLGGSYFDAFITHLADGGATHELEYNHSIYAFVTNLSSTGYGIFHGESLRWIQMNSSAITAGLSIFVLLCLGLLVFQAHRKTIRGFHAPLFMVCTIGALMLPSISHDYKLPMLTAPFVLGMSNIKLPDRRWRRIATILLIVLASLIYSATLVPWNARPACLHNAFPLLLGLLISISFIAFIQKEDN